MTDPSNITQVQLSRPMSSWGLLTGVWARCYLHRPHHQKPPLGSATELRVFQAAWVVSVSLAVPPASIALGREEACASHQFQRLSFKLFFCIYLVCIQVHMRHGTSVEVQRQLIRVGSILPLGILLCRDQTQAVRLVVSTSTC